MSEMELLELVRLWKQKLEQDLSRLAAVKELFGAYINRSIAYKDIHVVKAPECL